MSSTQAKGHALGPIDSNWDEEKERNKPLSVSWCGRETHPRGHGVNISFLLALHGGEVLSTMAGPEHHWYRWELRLRQDLGGYGDREVFGPALGGDSRDGMIGNGYHDRLQGMVLTCNRDRTRSIRP